MWGNNQERRSSRAPARGEFLAGLSFPQYGQAASTFLTMEGGRPSRHFPRQAGPPNARLHVSTTRWISPSRLKRKSLLSWPRPRKALSGKSFLFRIQVLQLVTSAAPSPASSH